MKHLILDVNIVVDACTNRSSSVESVAAIAKAKAAGVALWVYAGSVQTLEFVLASEIVRLNAKLPEYQDSNLHETKLDEIKSTGQEIWAFCEDEIICL